MLLDRINLNQVRVFECVFRTRSMTSAADELHLTQSGVSQHIKSLEEALGCTLFDRINQKLVPTNAGKQFYERIHPALDSVEHALQELKGESEELSGTVAIGMPMEFGHYMIMPRISELAKQFPQIRFHVRFGFAEEMNSLIMDGHVDFAFVDAFAFDKRITTQVVYEETLELCTSKDFALELPAMKSTKSFFEELDYVEYQESAPVVRLWLEHHFQLKNIQLKIRARVPSVMGVSLFIQKSVGAGILPEHKLERLAREGIELHRIKGSKNPLKNAINIAYLSSRTLSPVSLKVRQLLSDSLN